MARVVSPHLVTVGAAWEDGPPAGRWIADRLASFGSSVGHAVPLGYAGYAAVPIPWDDDPAGVRGPLIALEALLEVLAPFTGEQRVHCGVWDGWSWWYDRGTDPRVNTGAGVLWPKHEPQPSQAEIDGALSRACDWAASRRVERPDVVPLELPHRSYYLWLGPLNAATAFRHQPQDPPSLIWPEDRSWFVGAPIYTNEIAVAGPVAVVDAVLASAQLNARTVTSDDELYGDD